MYEVDREGRCVECGIVVGKAPIDEPHERMEVDWMQTLEYLARGERPLCSDFYLKSCAVAALARIAELEYRANRGPIDEQYERLTNKIIDRLKARLAERGDP